MYTPRISIRKRLVAGLGRGTPILCLIVAVALLPVRMKSGEAIGSEPKGPKFPDTGHHVRFVGTAADGKVVVAVRNDGTVDTWDLQTGKPGHSFRTARKQPFALSRDGTLVASQDPAADKGAVIEETLTGRTVGHTPAWPAPGPSPGEQGTFSADGKRLARALGWTKGEGVVLSGFAGGGAGGPAPDPARRLPTQGSWTLSVALSPAGDLAAAGGDNKAVEIWELKHQKRVRVLETEKPSALGNVQWVGFSPDGKLLACGTWCGPVQFWDVGTGKERFRGANPDGLIVWAGDFSPDGRFLACAAGSFYNVKGTIGVWDVQTGMRKASWVAYQPGSCVCLRFTPDGKSVVVGTTDEGQVQLWDWGTQKLIRVYEAKK